MIPKAEGGSTPIAPCVLPVVCRVSASVRLGHLQKWFYSWVPSSVFSAGKVCFIHGLVCHLPGRELCSLRLCKSGLSMSRSHLAEHVEQTDVSVNARFGPLSVQPQSRVSPSVTFQSVDMERNCWTRRTKRNMFRV